MTRLVFDSIIFSLQRTGGISRFWSKLVARHANEPATAFVERRKPINLYRRDMNLASILPDHSLPVRISRYLDFRRGFAARDAHIFHSSYYRSNLHPLAINVTTVHDLIYEKFEHGPARAIHIWQKTRALRRADSLVCVSEATRRDLLEHYPFCASKRIEIIPNGVDPAAPADNAGRIPAEVSARRFVLYVGHRGACKGFDRTYDLLAALPADVIAVVVGAPFSALESETIAKQGLSDRIINLEQVNDATLSALYAEAAFFFFPSLYEGFGIPPIEAMQQGCVVLATNRSSVPEVVGEAALLFDPDDRATMVRHAQAILSGEHIQELRKAGRQRATMFHWRYALERYDALYDELLRVGLRRAI